jgi:hypothetical protein
MIHHWVDGNVDASNAWDTGLYDETEPNLFTKVMKQVKTGLNKMLDQEAIDLTNSIITNATGKPELAGGTITLAQMQLKLDAAEAAMVAEGLGVDALAEKRTVRADAMAALRSIVDGFANQARIVYGGDKAKLQAISLDVRKAPTPLGPLSMPLNLQSFTGVNEGTIELQWEPLPGRPMYFVECATSASGPWTLSNTERKSRTTCTGLAPGVEYFFRLRAKATGGYSPYSDITKKRAA